KVTDVVKEGDTVKVKVLSIDDRGKIKLSMRGIDQETGEETEPPAPRRPAGQGEEGHGERHRRDRGPRRHRRAGRTRWAGRPRAAPAPAGELNQVVHAAARCRGRAAGNGSAT